MATDIGVEVSERRPRKISRCLDDNWQNEHVIVTNEEKLRVNFMISERRFNQESRQESSST